VSEVTEQDVRKLYRQVLGAGDGRILLEDILFELKFMSECQNEGDMAMNNYAKRLLMLVFADDEGQMDSGLLRRILRGMTKKRILKENRT
jgi:hypothetical protein